MYPLHAGRTQSSMQISSLSYVPLFLASPILINLITLIISDEKQITLNTSLINFSCPPVAAFLLAPSIFLNTEFPDNVRLYIIHHHKVWINPSVCVKVIQFLVEMTIVKHCHHYSRRRHHHHHHLRNHLHHYFIVRNEQNYSQNFAYRLFLRHASR